MDEARRKLFAKKKQRPADPTDKCSPGAAQPTSSIPGRPCLGQTPTLPSPTNWGWIKTSGMYELLWTTLPEASKICRELVSCNYKEGCMKKCKCKNNGLECAHCVLAVGVALRTELAHLRRRFWTFPYRVQGLQNSKLIAYCIMQIRSGLALINTIIKCSV